jgi:hypothetical protein
MGPNNTWTFQTFQQADLMGDVSIVVEDGTNVPKTALGKRAAMEQANNMQFVNAADPDVKHAFLSEMGLSNLMPSLDASKKAALRQQDKFEQWVAGGLEGPPPLRVQPWDDVLIMLNELNKWANSDKMQALLDDEASGPIVTQILTMFHGELQMRLMPAVGPDGAPLDPAAGGGGEPGHGAGGGQAMSRSNQNSTTPAIANNGNPTAPVAGAV